MLIQPIQCFSYQRDIQGWLTYSLWFCSNFHLYDSIHECRAFCFGHTELIRRRQWTYDLGVVLGEGWKWHQQDHQVCCLIAQPSMWNLVLLPRATLFLLLLLRISVGIEAMVSGICVCHSLTVVPTKSSLIFSRKGALRGNTINGLLKCLDTLRSLDR